MNEYIKILYEKTWLIEYLHIFCLLMLPPVVFSFIVTILSLGIINEFIMSVLYVCIVCICVCVCVYYMHAIVINNAKAD